MMNLSTFHKILTLVIFLILVNSLTHCTRDKQIQEIDKLSGLDGSFETTDSGFSIKWQINETLLKTHDAGLFLDKTEKKDGVQSLKLQVQKTDTFKQFPGISTSLAVMPNKKYKLSFWIKNSRAAFYVKRHSSSLSGEQVKSSEFVLNNKNIYARWHSFSDTLLIGPDENNITLDFAITGPGVLWIDKVMFEELDD